MTKSPNLRGELGEKLIESAPNAYGYPLLIKSLLHTGLTRSPDQLILYQKFRMTYRDLTARVSRLANMLTRLGVTAGRTVGILDWDSHRYLETYFAVPGIGAILHTVNIRLSVDQILYSINHACDDVLLVNEEFLPVLEKIYTRLTSVDKIIIIADDGLMPSSFVPLHGEYEALIEQESSFYDFPDLNEDACATLFYTTGTTGDPKGVCFSHRQIVLHTLSVAAALGSSQSQGRLHTGDVYMPITPMFHVHAWGLPYVATMLGLKQCYPGRYQASSILKLRSQEGVTFSHCVPTLLKMLLEEPADGNDLSGWKMLIGGSSLPAGLAREACRRGIDVFTGYGMSESCPVLTIAQLTDAEIAVDPLDDAGSRLKAGHPIPLVDIALKDLPGSTTNGLDEPSTEIVARAPWLAQAYLGNPEASLLLWEDGVMHTGDVGTFDVDGRLRISDRLKDVIKTGGEWVSSSMIEDLISRHADVAEVAVIGIPDARWGERPLALIVPHREATITLTQQTINEHLKRFVSDGIISRWAIPQIKVVEDIRKTGVGKIDKKLLRKMHEPRNEPDGQIWQGTTSA